MTLAHSHAENNRMLKSFKRAEKDRLFPNVILESSSFSEVNTRLGPIQIFIYRNLSPLAQNFHGGFKTMS